jgi:hypothetical protein
MTTNESNHEQSVGLWAGTLAVTELGLGSLLHALHVPLTGTLLSLNQGLFLSRVTRVASLQTHHNQRTKTLPLEISSITAILKSLSPVGKRLTPMLAIAAQGFLFTSGTVLLGPNLLGVLVGSLLLSMWAVAQPALLAGIMFTALSNTEQNKIVAAWQKMLSGIDYFTRFNIADAVLVLLAIKFSIAAALALFAWYSPVNQPKSLWAKLERRFTTRLAGNRTISSLGATEDHSILQSLRHAVSDLKNPMLWISLGLLVGLSYFLDSEWVPAVWIGMRSLAAIYIFYAVLRLLPWTKILNSKNGNATALRAALNVINQKSDTDSQPLQKITDGITSCTAAPVQTYSAELK